MGEGHQALRRKRQLKALAAAVCGLLCTAAFAQDRYPARPVRLIVPYPPGGANDIIGRLIGGKLTERWGYQVVVENRPGSAGNIGAGVLARSAPDGYTLMIGGAGTLTVARTPQPIVDKLSADIQGVVRLPDVQERLSSQGFEPVGSSAEQFVVHIRSELAKWEKVVRESGARAD